METKYLIEHFQFGKFDDPELPYGAGFNITALSRGLQSTLASLEQIPKRLALDLQLKQLETFEDAYGWLRHRKKVVVARFQRSPTIESRERPSYFIQAHYAIVPLQIIEELKGCVRPLFDLLESNIPRYHKLQFLPPIEVRISELVDTLPRRIDDTSIPFVQSIFHNDLTNDLTVFDGLGMSSIERLNFLNNLVMCFPIPFRFNLTYITLLDTSIYNTSIYRGSHFKLAFSHEKQGFLKRFTRSGKLNPQSPPQLVEKSLGVDYTRWLETHNQFPLDDNFFHEIRYPITKKAEEIGLDDLEKAARFIRLKRWLDHTIQNGELKNSLDAVPSILHKYRDLFNENEIISVFDALSEESLNEANISSMLLAERVASEYILDLMCRFLSSAPRIRFLIRSILSWIFNNKDNKIDNSHAFNLINILIENGIASDVVTLPWWNTYSLSTFRENLTSASRAVLREKTPSTLLLIECLSSKSVYQNTQPELLLQSYQEIGHLDWLYLTTVEAIRMRRVHLLPSNVLNELNSIFKANKRPEMIATIISEMQQNQIWSQACAYVARSGKDPNLEVEKTLENSRDFLLSVISWYPDNLKEHKITLQKASFYIFELFANHVLSVYKDISIRDAKFDNWGRVYANTIKNGRLIDGINPDKLEQLFVLSALARTTKEFSPFYINILAEWSRKIDVVRIDNLYAWLAITAHRHKFPRKLRFTDELTYHLSEGIIRVVQSHFPQWPDLMLDYLFAFTVEAIRSRNMAKVWHRRLQELPFLLPSYTADHLETLERRLRKNQLVNEANILRDAIDQLHRYLQQSEEIVELLRTAEDSLTRLIQYSEYVTSLKNADDHRFFFLQIKRILKEKQAVLEAASLARKIQKLIEKDTARGDFIQFLKSLDDDY